MATTTGPLRVGTAQVVITPPLGCNLQGSFTPREATDIHDDLFAKAIVLDNGATRLAFLIVDLIVLPTELCQVVAEEVDRLGAVPRDGLLCAATHTHYGPAMMDLAAVPREDVYLEWVVQPLVDAVVMAARRLQPAEFAYAVDSVPTEVHNRRHYLTDGTVRMNPPVASPELVRPAGPVDPAIHALIFRTPAREPLAVLSNLSLHYVGSGPTDVSADYFGAFASALQRCAGRSFVVAMSNGCSGDINNINFARPRPTSPHPYHQVERVAAVCAGAVWKSWNTLWEEDFSAEATLGAATTTLTMHPRRPGAPEVAEALTYLSEHDLSDDATRWVYARETVLMQDFASQVPCPIQALRVGEVGVATFPGEVFCQIGLDVRAASPLPATFCVGLANGFTGYIPTDLGLEQGGYETWLCRWAYAPAGTEQAWREAALGLLASLT